MGGKNHKPCGLFLKNSTLLSRALSVAYAELELSNVALEDLILAELSGSRGTVDPIIFKLNNSIGGLASAQEAMTALRQQMDEANYTDLPTLHSVDWDEVGSHFIDDDLIGRAEWSEAVSITCQESFYGMLSRFDLDIAKLVQESKMLCERIAHLEQSAIAGDVNTVLEENRTGNIRPQFARLYSKWAAFNQLFLASSLLSTEVWYAFNNHGSMVIDTQISET